MFYVLILFFATPLGQSILDVCGQCSNVISDHITNETVKMIVNFFFDIMLNHWPTM